MGFKTWHTSDVKIMVRSGNLKLGNIANLSKDASTCGVLSKYCRDFCYMGSAYYKSMKHCVESHKRNGEIFMEIEERNLWKQFVFDMSSFIIKKNLHYFRIDVNGDLVSERELFAWIDVAKVCASTKFWLPTKRFYWLTPANLHHIRQTPNLHVACSVFFNMPNQVVNMAKETGLPIAYADSENKYKYKVCSKSCEECLYCYEGGGNVFLPIHGTEAVKKRREYTG